MNDDWLKFYPEIQTTGSLRAALATELVKLQSPFAPTENDDWFPKAYSRVESRPRFSQVYVAAQERLFLPDFWSNGVCMASGNCPDFRHTASAILAWLSSPALRVAGLAQNFPWVKPKDGAEIFEEGREVDWRWNSLINDEDRIPDFRALVKRASNEPRLRELFPYSSMHTLCFSRCTGYPYTRDTPFISPRGNGMFRVTDANDRELGFGDADKAVQIAVASLPEKCGPAWAGTADDQK